MSHPEPFFIDGKHGRLFAVLHHPSAGITHRGNVLCIPAFNEEMNRCRSMLTLQALAFAQRGFATLVPDLLGTGESDGEHGDARWNIWLDDIASAWQWLARRPGGCSAILAVRLGVPLALQAMGDGVAAPALIAWQPVVDGKSYFTQFLRMRIAANMDRTDIPKDTTTGMRAELAAGVPIEVAGYEVHPELAAAIEGIRLEAMLPPANTAVAWFEKAGGSQEEISPASQKVVEGWRNAGQPVDVNCFSGQAFWALHDRVTAPDLIQATADWLAQQGGLA